MMADEQKISKPCKATTLDLWDLRVVCDKPAGHDGFHRDSAARYNWRHQSWMGPEEFAK